MTNLTPHAINISTNGGFVEIPPSGHVARLSESTVALPRILVEAWSEEVNVVRKMYGSVIGYEPQAHESVIVATPMGPQAATAWPQARVYSPDSGPDSAIRDARGNLIGVTRLIMWSTLGAAEGCGIEVTR